MVGMEKSKQSYGCFMLMLIPHVHALTFFFQPTIL